MLELRTVFKKQYIIAMSGNLPNQRLDVQPKLQLLWYPAFVLYQDLHFDSCDFPEYKTVLLP